MKYFELSDNENKIYQNLRDETNIGLREECIIVNTYIINKKVKINRISFHSLETRKKRRQYAQR